ncbi:hypothetical protein BKA66DRAFT_583205 [Pyrenochaeta sp. MPI-SDFR-AT-0127]|nr:hypothetical protein BKA66DRAFT_583205 [Pyrenochaeta sp. MPI-SDFR-AT-0127]
MAEKKDGDAADDNNSAVPNTLQFNDVRTSPHIPPEVLQIIFRLLGFYDLLFCQGVCKAWAAFIPGKDPVLQRKLFSRSQFAFGFDPNTDKANPLPCIFIRLTAPVDVVSGKVGLLPELAFGLEVQMHSKKNFTNTTIFHPVIRDFDTYMHLVNPNFKAVIESHALWRRNDRLSHCLFSFKTLEQLKNKTVLPKNYEYNDGSWKDMLLCVNAVEQVQIDFEWDYEGFSRTYFTPKIPGQGTTVGQYVSCIRQFLAHAEDHVKGFAYQMGVACESCGWKEDIDGLDMLNDAEAQEDPMA